MLLQIYVWTQNRGKTTKLSLLALSLCILMVFLSFISNSVIVIKIHMHCIKVDCYFLQDMYVESTLRSISTFGWRLPPLTLRFWWQEKVSCYIWGSVVILWWKYLMYQHKSISKYTQTRALLSIFARQTNLAIPIKL